MSYSDQDSGIRDQFRAKGKTVIKFTVAAAVLGVLLTPANASAQEKPWDKIPVPPLAPFHPHEPKRIELKNGIVIFLQEDHELPFVSGSVLIPGGSRDEQAAKAGMIDLYGEAWRTSGSEKMSGDAMDDLLEAKAAHIETGGDDDSTALSWDSLKGDSDQVFDLAMDLLFHPKFSEEKLELAKQQEATGIVRRNDEEGEIAAANRRSWSTERTVRTRGSRSWRRWAQSLLADLNAWHDRTLKGKLIVERERRLRPRGDGSQAACNLRSTAAGEAAACASRGLSRAQARRSTSSTKKM